MLEYFFEKSKEFYASAQYTQLNPKECDQSDALASIIFSALSIEAFLNELPEIAAQRQEEEAKSLVRVIQPLIDKRKPTLYKLLEASKCTSDSPLEEKTLPYKHVEDLIDLRNRIVHLKAGDTLSGRTSKHKDIINKLRYAGVSIDSYTVTNNDDEFHFPFIALISTQPVAEWACNVVANIVKHFVNGMRESIFKELLQSYADAFEPISKISQPDLVSFHTAILKNGCKNLDEFLEKIKNGQLVVISKSDLESLNIE